LAGTWRDLNKRWEEVSDDKMGQLATVEGKNGIFNLCPEKALGG
jgi:hypothetical protein